MASATESFSKTTLRQVVSLINEKTRGFLEDFLVYRFNLCPECLSVLVHKDEVTNCGTCGLVVTNSVEDLAWIGDDHKPVNQLAFGRDQGDTLQFKGLYCVLAQNNDVDLPLRAKQISILTRKFDHPRIESMLRVGRDLSNLCGFGDHKDIKSVQFSNVLGRIMRTIGAFIALYNNRTPIDKVARACFLVTFKYTNTPKAPTPESLGVSPGLYEAVWSLYEKLRPFQTGF